MRPILSGPFGSMGSLWLKLRVICVEDMIIEGILSVLNILRILQANHDHEVWSAWASIIGSTCIFFTTSILVLDGSCPCTCIQNMAFLTPALSLLSSPFSFITDKQLMRLFFITSQLGIFMGIVGVISECMTLSNETEGKETAIQVPIFDNTKYFITLTEHDQAICIILLQFLVTIPWRLYTMKVSKGVLDAIHITEELDFRCTYGENALKMLLPRTATPHQVDIAHRSDFTTVCQLQYTCHAKTYQHMGVPSHLGIDFLKHQWRLRGKGVIRKWLGRTGVVRDASGHAVGALNLQLPGDAAAFDGCPSDFYGNPNNDYHWLIAFPAPSPSVPLQPAPQPRQEASAETPDRDQQKRYKRDQAGVVGNKPVGETDGQTPPTPKEPSRNYIQLMVDGLRALSALQINWKRLGLYDPVARMTALTYVPYRLRNAILCDHVCAPGEAFIEFVCVDDSARGDGIGTRLVKWAEMSAEALGCGRITLTIEGENTKAIRFFEKLGYKMNNNWTDCLSILWFRLLFGTKLGYLKMEKPIGQEQGFAVHSNLFGFVSERLENLSRHDGSGSIHSAFGLLNTGSFHDISSDPLGHFTKSHWNLNNNSNHDCNSTTGGNNNTTTRTRAMSTTTSYINEDSSHQGNSDQVEDQVDAESSSSDSISNENYANPNNTNNKNTNLRKSKNVSAAARTRGSNGVNIGDSSHHLLHLNSSSHTNTKSHHMRHDHSNSDNQYNRKSSGQIAGHGVNLEGVNANDPISFPGQLIGIKSNRKSHLNISNAANGEAATAAAMTPPSASWSFHDKNPEQQQQLQMQMNQSQSLSSVKYLNSAFMSAAASPLPVFVAPHTPERRPWMRGVGGMAIPDSPMSDLTTSVLEDTDFNFNQRNPVMNSESNFNYDAENNMYVEEGDRRESTQSIVMTALSAIPYALRLTSLNPFQESNKNYSNSSSTIKTNIENNDRHGSHDRLYYANSTLDIDSKNNMNASCNVVVTSTSSSCNKFDMHAE